MPFVLDASTALAWCFKDEATHEVARILALAEEGERIFVPLNWPLEVLNGVIRGNRRGRLSEADADRFLSDLALFDVIVSSQPIATEWSAARHFALQYRLSAYDAAYLALAVRLNIGLATLDNQLRLAAQIEGIPLEL